MAVTRDQSDSGRLAGDLRDIPGSKRDLIIKMWSRGATPAGMACAVGLPEARVDYVLGLRASGPALVGARAEDTSWQVLGGLATAAREDAGLSTHALSLRLRVQHRAILSGRRGSAGRP